MAGRRRIIALICTSLAICACSGQKLPTEAGPIGQTLKSPTSVETLDFLGAIYSDPYVIAVGDIDSNGVVAPLGTKNDGFGSLHPLIPAGLETLLSPLAPREQHTGRQNRDTRLADFDNDGFPDVISNTYDCVDKLNSEDIARLYKNNGDGTFTEVLNPFRDSKGNSLTLQGRGETIVVADFNNDGFLDIFLPYYTYKSADPDPDGPPGSVCENSPQSYLLINDGTGHFTDVADQAGVSQRNLAPQSTAEGAQALDFNNDGLIDLYAGSHFFINTGVTNGIPRFVDRAREYQLPIFFDEGAKFIDAYNDGFLDLVLLAPDTGPALFKFVGHTFVEQPSAFPADTYVSAVGVNAYDINNDGLEDVVITGGSGCDPKIFLNIGSGFNRVSPRPRPFTLDKSGGTFNGLCLTDGAGAFGDLNNDGKIDFLWATFTDVYVFLNDFQTDNPVFVVEVVGPHGEHNQQGRVVRMSPQSRPDLILTRVVDSGSGYLSQNQYPLLIASPYSEKHVVRLSLPQNDNSKRLVAISFTISPGQRALVFAPSAANPDGRVELTPMRPFTFDPALYPAAQGILE
jgi:hypothetical protein